MGQGCGWPSGWNTIFSDKPIFIFPDIHSLDLFREPIYVYTSSTAQGGGGSFKNRKPNKERLVLVNHRWQSESTDGPTGGSSCVFLSGCNGCSGHLTATAGCSVV